jgi:hypothetical protein
MSLEIFATQTAVQAGNWRMAKVELGSEEVDFELGLQLIL